MIGPKQPFKLNPHAASFVPRSKGREAAKPTSEPPAAKAETKPASDSPSPSKARLQYESLQHLLERPDIAMSDFWHNGSMPFFPTGQRKPTADESAMLLDFAAQVNSHRDAELPVPLQPHRLHKNDPLRSGEYGATYRMDPSGAPVREDFRYNPDQSVDPATSAQTRMVIHSHPMQILRGPIEPDNLAVRMPSVTDHQAASLDRMKSGADNYLMYGDRVTHFTGEDLQVTELRPSPLQGKMPKVTP